MSNGERGEEDINSHLRETDRWLRRVTIYVPIITFILGWGSGVITTYIVFKDHERRIAILEKGQIDQNVLIQHNYEMLSRVVGMLEGEHKGMSLH
jgi:hypothetical protein